MKLRVVAALALRDGALLAQQRPLHKAQGGLWELPGGKVEAGESDEAALARECREELGVRVRVGARLWETRHLYPDREVHLVVYRVEIEAGEPRAHDAERIAWIPLDRLADYPFCPADLPFLERLAAGGF
ncbi:MAG TPA: (deoxy)nucleoside triphosphate pyrophosphohydrolase [Fredinandcohnia sp.]|nr:(deoxy)nucleoside triphosphate pyrophosphohydrolase [Fredinandcohnia sp.]